MSKYDDLVALHKEVLDEGDYYPIKNEETGKEDTLGLGMVGCLKLAAELDYTHRIVDERCIEEGKYVRYEFTVEVLDKEGRVLAQDVGSCDTAERPDYNKHNLRAFAKTRAWQRALKSAAKVADRLASDLHPTESLGGAAGRPAASSPPPEPTGPECTCDVNNITEPYKGEDGTFICGTCGQTIHKKKRMEYLSVHS